METEIKNPVLRFFVYGHVWLSLGAAAQVWWMSEQHWFADGRLALFAGSCTMAAYGAMRLSRMRDSALDASPMVQWYRANARSMFVVVLVASALSVVLAWPKRVFIVDALWLPGVLSALYVLPTMLTRGRSIGLRNVPLLKAFLIAYVWAALTTILPFTSERLDGIGITTDSWWMVVTQGCYFLALAICFDIRDLPFDPPSLRTMPQVLGLRAAKVIAVLLLLPMTFFLLVMTAITYEPIEPGWRDAAIDFEYALPLLGVVLVALLIIRANAGRRWWFWSILLDGALVLLPLLSWIGSLV